MAEPSIARTPARRLPVGGTVLALAAAALGPVALAPSPAAGAPGDAPSAGLVAVEHQLPTAQYATTFQTDIAVMRPDGSGFTPIVTGPAQETDPAWSADGSRLAYVVTEGTGSTATSAIWTVDADGSDALQVTPASTGTKSSPTWSPGGETIAFVWSGDIWFVGYDGLTAPDNGVAQAGVTDVDYSPDGTRWVLSRGGGLYTMPADDSQAGGSSLGGAAGSDPTWSPDGTQVAFVQGAALRRVAAGGGTSTLVPGSPYLSRPLDSPTWSPDGETLLFTRFENTGAGLTSHPYNTNVPAVAGIPATGGTTTPVTGGAPRVLDPDWSPTAGGSGSTDPATGSTSNGQTFAVTIDAPGDGDRVPGDAPLPVSGAVSLDASTARPVHAGYVVDVSGSTTSGPARNCDGVGSVTAADNYNGDGRTGDILDCELWAVAKLNERVATRAASTAGVVALGGQAIYWEPPTGSTPTTSAGADMSSAGGEQPSVPASDAGVGVVLRSLLNTSGSAAVGQYSLKRVGSGTDYEAALRRVNAQLGGFDSAEPSIVYFLSDGQPMSGRTDWTAADHPLAVSAARGYRVHTYAVGVTGGCNPGQALRVIADRTGGTCTLVADPALLSDQIAANATVDSVSLRLPDGTRLSATVDSAAGTWDVSIPAGALPPGSQQLRVTATASDGTTVTDTVTVHVTATPEVDAGGPYTVDEGSSIALAGTATDADTDAADLAIAWSPNAHLDADNRLDPTYTGVDDAVEELTLSVTDPDGLEATDTAEVTVANVAPTLGTPTWAAGREPVAGEPATLTVDVTDPGTEDTHTYVVDWGDGSPPTTGEVSGGTVSATHTFAAGTQQLVGITVVDDDGGDDATEIGPFRVNTTPTADAGGPYTVDEGTPLTLSGTASDDDDDPLTITWTPAGRLLSGADTATPEYDTRDEVEQDLTMEVSDGDLTSRSRTSVTVRNVAPSLTGFALPAGVVAPGTPVTLDVTVDDPGLDDTIEWTLDWGDGTTATGTGRAISGSHAFGEGGPFDVVLTVTDGDGGEASERGRVVTNRAPTVDAGADLALVEGATGTPATASDDPDGDTVSHTWATGPACSGVVTLSATDVPRPVVTGVDDGSCQLRVTVSDGSAEATDTVDVTVANAAPTLGVLTATPVVARLGTPIELTAPVRDPGQADTHDASVDWGAGGSPEPGSVAGDAFSATHLYPAPGVYTVQVWVTDDDGGTSGARSLEVVVYDPASAKTTGGGHLSSPTGALTARPAAGGKATFGFEFGHHKKTGAPEGNLRFQLHATDGDLKSTDVTWVATSTDRSTSQGTGTWSGTPARWRLTVVDGKATGTSDRLRLQVWTGSGLDVLAYDTGGLVALGGGSIVVH